MKGRKKKTRAAKMLKEYDFSRGVRGNPSSLGSGDVAADLLG